MSLLMDALRRAEQEKKQQQARQETQTADDSLSVESAINEPAAASKPVFSGSDDVTLQIEADALQSAVSARIEEKQPTGEVNDGAITAANRLGEAQAFDLAADEDDNSVEFRLDDDSLVMKRDDDPFDRSRALFLPDELALEPRDDDATIADLSGIDADPAGGDDTGSTTMGALPRVDQTQTLPSSSGLENDLNAYFDRSQSMEIPGGQTTSSAELGDQTLEDVAAHTIVSAQTVFAAGEQPRSGRMFIIAAAAGLLIVLGIGAVGVFYAQKSPGPRYLPPPTVADGVERPLLRELPVIAVDNPPALVATEPVRIETHFSHDVTTAAIEPIANDSNPALAEPFAAGVASKKTALAQAVPEPTSSAASGETTAAPAKTSPPAVVPITRPVTPASHRNKPVLGVAAGELSIARTIKPAAIDSDVESGYGAYNNGQLDLARQHYAAALKTNGQQRDALLGMAAVALAKGDQAQAHYYYRATLKAYPGDAVATAGLLGLSGKQSAATAARLRMMRDRNPDAPYVHFALGNWYARQARWGDAQQAYFDAFRLDSNNPDYAYNLAVSLEQLGQGEAALSYYQQSLSLLDHTSASFNSAVVLGRINELSAGTLR